MSVSLCSSSHTSLCLTPSLYVQQAQSAMGANSHTCSLALIWVPVWALSPFGLWVVAKRWSSPWCSSPASTAPSTRAWAQSSHRSWQTESGWQEGGKGEGRWIICSRRRQPAILSWREGLMRQRLTNEKRSPCSPGAFLLNLSQWAVWILKDMISLKKAS